MRHGAQVPGGAAVKGYALFGTAIVLALLQSCSRQEDQAAKAYEQQLQACQQQLQQNPLVPIIGGGHLDTRRYDFNVPTVRFEDGQCGTDGFETSFYWTGEKIVPTGQKFTGLLSGEEIPKHWRRLNVAARLGNQRKGRECKEHFDPKKCVDPKHKNPGLPPSWPEDRIVRPKAYPGLEIWIPEKPFPSRTRGVSFVMKGWPRNDGATPRTVYCWAFPDSYPIETMSRTDLENLDFGSQTMPCDVEGWNFDFKGGAARIGMSTAILSTITPALQSLQTYISDSIIREQ